MQKKQASVRIHTAGFVIEIRTVNFCQTVDSHYKCCVAFGLRLVVSESVILG